MLSRSALLIFVALSSQLISFAVLSKEVLSKETLSKEVLSAKQDIAELMLEGNVERLQGDMPSANKIKDRIAKLAPNDPASYAFNLNTIVTELSWEESQTRFDEQLQRDASRLLELCENKLPSQAEIDNPDFYCGHAHFALSYYNGIRGNLIRAGRHGTTAIDYMEQALEQDPSLTRAKMYLGIAYYYADNLPPFIKLFSRVLWFIPSGNSDRSLPYLREVMSSKDAFNDVARYIYATLLINGSPEEVEDAISELQILLAKYPENVRFHLRYISVLIGENRFQDTLASINQVYKYHDDQSISMINNNLLNIWASRAHLGLGDFEAARTAQDQIQFAATTSSETMVPSWGLAWHALTNGQLADLAGKRKQAIESYEQILKLNEQTFINPQLVSLAQGYIDQPYVWVGTMSRSTEK